VDSALHGATLINSLKTPGGYTPKLERLLPAPLPVAVVIDLVEPDDDLRECRPSHGLRVPAFLHQPARTQPGKKNRGWKRQATFFLGKDKLLLNWNVALMRCHERALVVSVQYSRFEVWRIALELALEWRPHPLEPDRVSWILWRSHRSFNHLMITHTTKDEWTGMLRSETETSPSSLLFLHLERTEIYWPHTGWSRMSRHPRSSRTRRFCTAQVQCGNLNNRKVF